VARYPRCSSSKHNRAPSAERALLEMLMGVPPERWRKMVRRQAACVAPAFDLSCQLVYDAYRLVVDYPGSAVRVG
jgi:hypothetical protein